MGKFELKRRKDGEFQFVLKTSDGENILRSEGYTTKENCKMILALLLLFLLWRSCSPKTIPVDVPKASIERSLTELSLPNGVKLNAYKGGIEDQIIRFLQSKEYENATEDDLRDKWFNFDNIEFKFGSGTELMEGSQAQLTNVVQILNYFSDAKVKIGGYTDRVGSEEANLKVSQDRAETIKRILENAGVRSQVVSAEGYGDQFAKHSKDAPDSERAEDRIMALRFVK